MAPRKPIGYYGQFTPTGVDESAARRYRALAGIADEVGEMAFKIGAAKREEAGKREGAIAGAKAVEEGVAPEKKEGFLSSLSIYDQSYNNAMESAYLAGITTDAKLGLDRIATENPDNSDAFEKRASQYVEGIIGGVPQEYRDLVESTINNYSKQAGNSVYKNEIARNRNEAKSAIQLAINLHRDEAAKNARDGDEAQALLNTQHHDLLVDAMVASGFMLPDQAETEKGKVDLRNQQQKQIGDLETIIFNEDFTLQEKYDKGLRFVEQLREAEVEDLSPEEKDQLISVLEGKVDDLRVKISREEAEIDKEFGLEVSNLQVAVENKEIPTSEAIEKANELYNRDPRKFTFSMRTSVINKARSISQTEINKANSIKTVSQSLQGDTTALPTQKDVDTYYTENRSLFDESPNKIPAQAQFISSTRQVPTRVKSEVEAALYSGDLDQITNAIDLIDRVDNIPGMFDALVTPNQKALALQMTTLAEVMSIEEAAIEARKLTDPRNMDRINAARQSIKDEKYSEKYDKWTEDALGSMLPDPKARAKRQFGQLFELYYINGMSESQAKAEAEKAMATNWKESPDFGFMQYPPEDYYAVNGQTDYIKNQLYSDITTEFLFPEEVAKEDIFLVSDDYTAQTASTGRPAYIVMVRQANGELATLQDRDGSLYWTPDQQTEIEKQREIIEGKFRKVRIAGEPMTEEEKRIGQMIAPTI